MIRRFLIATLFVLSLPACRAPGQTVAAGAYDLLFLGDRGPLWLRLQIRVDGKSLAAREDDYHRRLFAFFDHDRKGFLDAKQAERAVRGDPLHRLLAPGRAALFRLAALTDGDKVTFTQFARYCRSRHRFLRVGTPAFPDPYANLLTRALFEALDADKDGKLSRAEVKAAPVVLADRDIDEDECLVPLELLPGLFTLRRAEVKQRDPDTISSRFVLVQPGEMRTLLRQKVFDRYDKNKDRKLSAEEIGWTPGDFARLDANRDGFLAETEVDRWLAGPAPLEAAVSLDEGGSAVVQCPDKGQGKGRLVLRLDKQELDLATGPAVSFEGEGADALRAVFRRADRERRGWVRAEDLAETAFKSLRRLLPLADRDGDGRLTRAELVGYLELRKVAEAGCVTLTLDDRARGWFEILDADHDGRLSAPELRDAWRRLADADADKTGFLRREKTAQPCTLTFSRGPTRPHGMAFYLARRNTARKGPLWFRKMDRNGDGFISKREWLGRRAAFDLMDRDGDGLISPAEAEAATARKE